MRIGGRAATGVRVIDGNSISAVTPAGVALGVVSVEVTNPNGRTGELARGFRYSDLPGNDGVDPNFS